MAVNLTTHPVGENVTLTQVALGMEIAFLIKLRDVDDMDIHISIPLEDDQDIEDVKSEAAEFLEYVVGMLRGEVA